MYLLNYLISWVNDKLTVTDNYNDLITDNYECKLPMYFKQHADNVLYNKQYFHLSEQW